MKTLPRDAGCDISRFRCCAVMAFVLLNLAVFFVRLISLWRYGTLFCTSGGESLMIYSVLSFAVQLSFLLHLCRYF